MEPCKSKIFDELKKGKLEHPTALKFSKDNWMQTYFSIDNPTERDINLFQAALCINHNINYYRSFTEQELNADWNISNLGQRTALILAVAMANRQYQIIQEAAKKNIKKTSKNETFVDTLSATRPIVEGAVPGNKIQSSDALDTIVDTLPIILHKAESFPNKPRDKSINITIAGEAMFLTSSAEKTLSQFWQMICWEDWILKENERIQIFPNDPDKLIKRSAWLWRQQANNSSDAHLALTKLNHQKRNGNHYPIPKYRTVIGLEKKVGKKKRFIIGNSGNINRISHHLESRLIAEKCYLKLFLDEILPNVGMSVNKLLNAWEVLLDAALILSKSQASISKEIDHSNLNNWALLCKTASLTQCLQEACSLTQRESKKIIDFFTYNTEEFRKGLWSMPLVKVDEHNSAICLTSMEIGDRTLRIEHWLERGGLADALSDKSRQSQGLRYESWVRNQITDSINNNEILNNAQCLPSALNPNNKVGDIDLIIQLGSKVLICEVKCFITPHEAIDHYNYKHKKLNKALKQIKSKHKWSVDNKKTIKKHLRINNDCEIEIIPLIIVNQSYGFSDIIDEYIIVDFHFLNLYIGNSTISVNASIGYNVDSNAIKTYTFYSTQKSAETNLISTLTSPWVLERYIDRAKWQKSIFPAANNKQFEFHGVVLGPPTEEQTNEFTKISQILLDQAKAKASF